MEKNKILEILSSIIPISKGEGDKQKKVTVKDTYHIGSLSGNRLNSGTLRSQYIICPKQQDWDSCEDSEKKTIHSDQRVFVHKGKEESDDIWDVYTGETIDTENVLPIRIIENGVGLEQLLKTEREKLLREKYVKSRYKAEPGSHSINNNKRFIHALCTKPFLLLAGISGTGKSRKVKELAYLTCQKDSQLAIADSTTPGNYCLIEVKPNWHDSTELLGYYSNLSGKYHITPFMHFVYKATKYPEMPFFVCLDEMNLAPVEQYFAEYLSVLETRVLENDNIKSAELLKKEIFESCQTCKDDVELYTESELEVLNYLKENGLRLPENLFIIGTVNMDDTTHQFSRKVIDRAFTIEMNGDELSTMFKYEDTLVYPEEAISFSAFRPKYVQASDALNDEVILPYKDIMVENIPSKLTEINNILQDTPFKVSFRVQNELVLYLSTLIHEKTPSDDKELMGLINEATLVILLEKILPRVQGDEKLLGDSLEKLLKHVEDNYATENKNSAYAETTDKLKQMIKRLDNTYFTNFF